MKYKEVERLLKYISPTTLEEYVKTQNWIYKPYALTHIKIYQKYTNNKFYQIRIPATFEIDKYELAVYEVIEILTLQQGREMTDILFDLLELSLRNKEKI